MTMYVVTFLSTYGKNWATFISTSGHTGHFDGREHESNP